MKKMRTITIVVFLVLMAQSIFSQDIEKCKEVVKITIEAINAKSTVELEKYLAPDFEMANQTGDIAKLVLKQLFLQLGETVLSYEEKESSKKSNELTLIYTIKYSKMEQKDATFIFDENNKLKNFELFEMQVKTMDNSDVEVDKPTREVISIPFYMVGRLIAVDVMLNNNKRTFIFDSGSPIVILNSKYIVKSDTIKRKTISSSTGVGDNISGMDIEKVKAFEFAGIEMNNQDMITLDISHIEEALETEIYGLIGYELIKDYDLLFDYDKKILTLINPDYFSQYKQENLSKNKLTVVPFELNSHIPVIKATIGEKEYNFGIDCGAEINLMDDDLFVSMKNFQKKVEMDTLWGANNDEIEVKSSIIKKTYIGGKKFKNMNTVFNDMSHLNEGYKLALDGLFGYEILSKQRTIISYKRKEIIFID